MSAILKAGSVSDRPIAISTHHLCDLMGEAQDVIEAARRQAHEMNTDAKQGAERLWEEARREGLNKGYEEGLEQGRQKGYQTALQEAQAKFDRDHKHLAETLAAMLEEISGQRVKHLHDAQRDILDFAIHIAGRVAKSIGHLNREAAQQNLLSALTLVMGKSDATVKVHPDDLDSLRRFANDLTDQLTNLPHVKFVEDSSIAPGGVLILTEDCEIDATLDQQLEQIAGALTAGDKD